MKKLTLTNKKKGGKKKLKLHQAKSIHNKEELYLKLVLKNLGFLPEDIQRVIYKICLNTNMKEWKKEHTKKLKLTNDLFKEIDFPAIEGHYDDSWRIRKGLIGYLEYYGYDTEDRSNKWNNIKIIRPCHSKYILWGDSNSLKNDKIELYHLSESKFKPGLNDLIMSNKFTGDSGKGFWASKGCRCLTCDLIRLECCNQGTNTISHNVSGNLMEKYARTTYNPDEEIENRWVTKTKSQAKRDKEMDRRKKRNEKVNEKKQDQCV